ncbi:hypothetical protein JR064_00210 [Xanthomonas sp. CFBP 8703]|uniref:Uncharacterized protein n=1 Tax=Xanthomonas bonasiae TaxID=2810351 RepID=A0ABS3AXN8_9XANT|nr:hypothetical protein [Xanthomonas bonasiae]MBN6100589.1 hypothetical protein [Xanthomonas bonasiae]
MWQYDDDEGLWTDQDTGYSYNPIDDNFMEGEDIIALDDVPLAVRQALETTADNAIKRIISGANPILQRGEVAFTDEFEQDQEVVGIELEAATVFGSVGAGPCLIVFATGQNADGNGVYANGAHRDNAFLLGEEFLDEMSADISGAPTFYVLGGEVGSHTGVDGATMDYSRYYPFFLACEQSNVVFGGVTFPSNPTADDATSAALTLVNGAPQVGYWL